MVAAPYALSESWNLWRSGAGGTYPPSLYSAWMGVTSYSFLTITFYFLLPLLACIPYADSLCTDLSTHYSNQLICRMGRIRYFASKLIATSISSISVIVIPLIVNYIATACFIPALWPEPAAQIFPASPSNMLASLFYHAPQTYTIVFIMLAALYSAAFGALSIASSFSIHNRFIVMLTPFALCITAQFVLQGSAFEGFSPINALSPYQPYPSIYSVVVAIGILLLLIPNFITLIKGRYFEDV
ncbi:MAG: hypothetical protein LKF76_01690 [Eggerthellaceae bacterium]|nr:hypothetical protein [Eggerthellaceae bacterium]